MIVTTEPADAVARVLAGKATVRAYSAGEGLAETDLLLLPRWSGRDGALDRAALDAACAARARVVVLSVVGADPAAPEGYRRWHGELEALAQATGLPVAHLRLPGLMDDLLEHAPMIAAEGVLYGCQGDGAVAYVDAGDVGDVVLGLMERKAAAAVAYEVTGPAAATLDDVAALLADLLASEVEYVDMSPEAFLGGIVAAGVPPTEARLVTELLAYLATDAAAGTSSVVRDVTGRDPRPLRDFLDEHAHAFAAADRVPAG